MTARDLAALLSQLPEEQQSREVVILWPDGTFRRVRYVSEDTAFKRGGALFPRASGNVFVVTLS